MVVTLLKFQFSIGWLNFLLYANIAYIFVTFDVSQSEISLLKFSAPLNIALIFVTFEKSGISKAENVVMFLQFLNISERLASHLISPHCITSISLFASS